MLTYPQKICFGEMRASSVHDVLIYCRDHRCSYHVEINADAWPDDARLSDIEPNFTCTKRGKRGCQAELSASAHGNWLEAKSCPRSRQGHCRGDAGAAGVAGALRR